MTKEDFLNFWLDKTKDRTIVTLEDVKTVVETLGFDPEDFTSINDFIALQALCFHEGATLTRNDLEKITGIPRTTIYDTMERLILRNYARKISIPGGRGRPLAYYEAKVNF